MAKKLFLLVASVCLAFPLVATNYYAAPGATGDGKTIDHPGDLNTLASAKFFVVGDSLFLLDGVYYVTSCVDVKNIEGTADCNFFVGAYPGAHPVIDGSRMAYGGNNHCMRVRTPYVHVKDITVRYAGFKGLYVCNSFVTVENVDAYGNVDTGIQVKNGGDCLIINCDSHENFDYEQGGTGSPDFGGNADGFADKQFTGNGNRYINCRAWNNSDDGWDLYKRVSSTPFYFENCIAYANSPEYYDFTGNPRVATDEAWFNSVEGKTMTTTKKHTDTWTLTHYYNNGNKNGFKIGGAGVATDVTMYRCLAIANTKKGFDQNYTQGDVKLYNCTGYANNSNFNFHDAVTRSLEVRNCISYKGTAADEFNSSNYIHSSNSWDLRLTLSDDDFVSLDTALVRVERDSHGSVAYSALCCLAKGSACIDAGEVINGFTDYMNSKPDLGWKEYNPDSESVITIAEKPSVSSAEWRRLNVYNLSGEMVGMVSDGQLERLRLPSGTYVVCDFDSHQTIKIRL